MECQSSEQVADLDDEFSRHIPEHPLPDEIQSMTRDDTVCKFCGVSYLIHNEIKALEDKLQATEDKLKMFIGIEEREASMKSDLANLETKLKNSEEKLNAKMAEIVKLQDMSSELTKQIVAFGDERKKLQDSLQKTLSEKEFHEQRHSQLSSRLSSTWDLLKDHQRSNATLKEAVLLSHQEFQNSLQESQTLLLQKIVVTAQENAELKAAIEEFEGQSSNQKEQVTNMAVRLKATEVQLEQLKHFESEVLTLQKTVALQKQNIKDLDEELEVKKSNESRLQADYENARAEVLAKDDRIASLQSESEINIQSLEQNVQRLEINFKESETELRKLREENRTLILQRDENERRQETEKQQHSLSNVRNQELHESLLRCRADLEAMRKEREMMIDAHQAQIADLRDSFKRRLSEADHWPQKLQEAIDKERTKHNQMITDLEEQLKSNFIMELEIEKQKHLELLKKATQELKDSETKLKADIRSLQSRHKGELVGLHKQLAENKVRSREEEDVLREEIARLKKIITQLENSLGKLNSSGDQKIEELTAEVNQLQEKISSTNTERDELKVKTRSLQEEIHFLEETIRKECEERFELTEALSTAKEELLSFKRPPGGFKGRRSSDAPHHQDAWKTDRPSSGKSTKSEELSIYRKLVDNHQPYPPAKPKDLSARTNHLTPRSVSGPVSLSSVSSGQPDTVTSSNVNLEYEGQPVEAKAQILKGGVADSRKRISNAVGRT